MHLEHFNNVIIYCIDVHGQKKKKKLKLQA